MNRHRHAVPVAGQVGHRETALDPNALRLKVFGEDAFGVVLGQRPQGLVPGEVDRVLEQVVQLHPEPLVRPEQDVEARRRAAGGEHLVDHAHVLEDLQDARLDHQRPRCRGRGRGAVDDPHLDAVPAQLCCHGQSARTGADDQHRCVRVVHDDLPRGFFIT